MYFGGLHGKGIPPNLGAPLMKLTSFRRTRAVVALSIASIASCLLPSTSMATGVNCTNLNHNTIRICAKTTGAGMHVDNVIGWATVSACTSNYDFQLEYRMIDPSVATIHLPNDPGGATIWSAYNRVMQARGSINCLTGGSYVTNGVALTPPQPRANPTNMCVVLWHQHRGRPATSDGYVCNKIFA